MVQGFKNVVDGFNAILDWFSSICQWLIDFYWNVFNVLVSNPVFEYIKDVINTLIWNFFNTIIKIITQVIDFIAFILPDYTIPVPSVYFGNSKIVALINWVFPVNTFAYCVTIILVSIPAAFLVRPFLKIVLLAK